MVNKVSKVKSKCPKGQFHYPIIDECLSHKEASLFIKNSYKFKDSFKCIRGVTKKTHVPIKKVDLKDFPKFDTKRDLVESIKDTEKTIRGWKGSAGNALVGALFLMKKHKAIMCTKYIPLMFTSSEKKQSIRGVAKDYKKLTERQKKIFDKTEIVKYKGSIDKIKECTKGKKKRFVVVFLMIFRGTIGHSNLIIIDKKHKRIANFEPHGNFSPNQDVIDLKLNLFFKDILPGYIVTKGFRVRGPQTLDPFINLTRGESTGFCLGWSLLWADMRLSYPDVPIWKLNIIVIKLVSEDSLNFIRKYTTHVLKLQKEIRDKPLVKCTPIAEELFGGKTKKSKIQKAIIKVFLKFNPNYLNLLFHEICYVLNEIEKLN